MAAVPTRRCRGDGERPQTMCRREAAQQNGDNLVTPFLAYIAIICDKGLAL